MKLVRSNGRKLIVRDVGEPLLVLVADRFPLPHVDEIESDEAARERVRELLGTGLYNREK